MIKTLSSTKVYLILAIALFFILSSGTAYAEVSTSISSGPYLIGKDLNLETACTGTYEISMHLKWTQTNFTEILNQTCTNETITYTLTPSHEGQYRYKVLYVGNQSNSTNSSISPEIEFYVNELTIDINSDSNYGYVTVEKSFAAEINMDEGVDGYNWIIRKSGEEIYRETTGNTITYLFPETGDYEVFVKITDDYGNEANDTFALTIKAPSKVWFLVRDDLTDEPVADATITVSSQTKSTDTLGGVLFFLEKTAHVIQVSKEGYETYRRYVDVSEDSKTVTILLEPKKKDEKVPELDILSLDEVEISSVEKAVLQFRVYDSSEVGCDLFMKPFESYKWILQKSFNNIESYKIAPKDIEKTHKFTNVETGNRYDWKLECTDTYENFLERMGYFVIGQQTDMGYETINDQPAASATEQELSDKIDEAETLIDDSRDEIKGYDGYRKNIISLLEYEKELNQKEKQILGLKNTLMTTKKSGDTQDKKDTTYEELIPQLEKLTSELIVDVQLSDEDEETVNLVPETAEIILAEYANKIFPSSSINSFVQNNRPLNKEGSIDLIMVDVKIKYSSYNEEEYQFILLDGLKPEKEYVIKLPIGTENLEEISGGQIVPDTKLLETESDLLKILSKKKIDKVSYAVMDKLSKQNLITGNQIASKGGLPTLKFGLILLILFVGVMSYYVYNYGFDTVKEKATDIYSFIMKEKDVELQKVSTKVKVFRKHLKDNNLKAAQAVYHDINSFYRTLSLKQKSKALSKTKGLYDSFLLATAHHKLDSVIDNLTKHNNAEAREEFVKFEKMSQALPNHLKMQVMERSELINSTLKSRGV